MAARVNPAHDNQVDQIDPWNRSSAAQDVLAQHKMSHCRATDSVAVSVLPNVAIILSHPNPVLASEAGAKIGSAKACRIKACGQDLSQSKT
jgi:hypothetical protein